MPVAACGPSKLEQRVGSLEQTVSSVQRDQALAVSRLEEINRLNQSVYLLQDRVEQTSLALERVQSGAAEVEAEEPRFEPAPELYGLEPQPAKARPAETGEDPVTMYRKAYDLLKQARYVPSAELFGRLIERYPEHDLADNAMYWLGESDYAQKNYPRAFATFKKVTERYPSGNKVPDALLKMAFCQQALGENDQAKNTLQQLVKGYPWSAPAKIAKERLGSMG